MNSSLTKTAYLFFLLTIGFYSLAQKTDVYTSATTWTVPAGISTLSIKVYGGAGGTGGQDCGAGCTNAAAGPVGYVIADFNVNTGDVIGIYPGGQGANGVNNAHGTGGGSGGVGTYPSLNFNGGNGGNAGSSGSSGGGGGGGAASVVTINGTIVIVAGGAGGGGGMANLAGSGQAGASTTSANGTLNNGGSGTMPGGDGGGGGGGGGGQFGSLGGGVHAAGGESAGNGGFLGDNSVTGATAVPTKGNIAWTSPGQIEITHAFGLPVTWLSFIAIKNNNGVLLNWSTATEQNTKDYEVQHSDGGIDWNTIGTVAAAGNSSTVRQYSFIDQNPASGLNYYRLLQRDIDDHVNYSKIVSLNFSGAARELRIYPNPVTNGTLTIYLQQNSLVGIYNNIGIKLIEKEISAGEHLVNVSQLPAGIYFIKVKQEAALFLIQ